MLVGIQLLLGLLLAVFGFLSVLDYLSLRSLLDESGPHVAWTVVTDLHAVLAHSGAQAAELALALTGLLLAALALRRLRQTVS